MIGNILDNTTELYMMKYTFGEIFSSRGETLYKNPSDQTVRYLLIFKKLSELPSNPKQLNSQRNPLPISSLKRIFL